jgi:hypothetical protein
MDCNALYHNLWARGRCDSVVEQRWGRQGIRQVGWTALHHAMQKGQIIVVKTLLDGKARTGHGRVALVSGKRSLGVGNIVT